MELVCLCPLRASTFAWQAHSGTHALTVIVKATFVVEPGACSLAPAQEQVHEEDGHWNDDPARSVVTPSDKVPYKPRADVMLVGHAYTPGKQPARSVMTRLVVGELDKSIEVWCDRGFRVQDGQLLEGPRFTKMPLRWERAAGGPETNNPAGLRFDAAPDAYGMVSIPNLQPPGMFVSKRSDTFAPVCYGPVGGEWPARKQRLGRLAGTFSQAGWAERPLPEKLDPGYFQAAPPDQQVAEIRPNERIVLEGLHPEHARVVTNLPGVRPSVVVDRATGEREDVKLIADTLWIDTDRGVCCVVWRGTIGLRSADEAGRIAVRMEGAGTQANAAAAVEELAEDLLETIPPTALTAADGDEGEDLAAMTLVPAFGAKAAGPVMPFMGGERQRVTGAPAPKPGDAALPFGQPTGLAGLRAVDVAAVPVAGDQTMLPPMGRKAATPAPSATPIAPPAYVPPPPPVAAPRATAESVWASGGPSTAAPSRETIGSAAATAAAAAAAIATPSVDRASQEGAMAASNAAAGATPWSVPKRDLRPATTENEALGVEPAREMLQLLWYDPESIARMRRVPAWKKVFEELERSPRSREIEIVDGAREPWEIEDRQEVFQVLAKAPRTDGKGVDEALEGAIGEDGKFVPPMVLLAGEIEMPFDELEALKAAMSTAAPLVTAADEGLKAAVGVAKDFVQMPGLSAAPAVCEGLTTRIRDAFSREKKGLPADYLEQQMERVLLGGRHYQKREVFGGRFLRCLIWLPGEKGAIVGYLPEEVGKKVPMWRRWRGRVVGEVWPAQDQYEAGPVTVRGMALARGTIRPKTR
ncbi:DUF2169 family type VI secretion system accessory protein [Polyangium mundeleinium]|uniref:DUF2169 domain-containing protein n=1 Tax=Polyangium mundeleinium TaxID=2995306 RepID=A0ABT5EGS7_9BACT|nr:DUF2169 domain-containing protein [Polyangium mundeleinium]MDC0740694.1 DUF2169 domain-containing protein [Polyangium mundeleinium]